MKLLKGIQEFLEYKQAQRLSPRTLEDYAGILEKFEQHIGNRKIDEITLKDIQEHLASLNVSKKRVKNVHITLSSFWTWAVKNGICTQHIPRLITPPKPEKRVIVPIEKIEIISMLKAIRQSTNVSNREYVVPNAYRDQAIIFFLLDTGVRASELCQIRMKDIKNNIVFVHGKGSKDRAVPLSPTTKEHIASYLSLKKRSEKDFVFRTKDDNPLTPDSLRSILVRVAKKAGLSGIHTHRFRHTFAINFLRNDGDIFSLQMILGHETLDMVKRYLAIAQADIQAAHRKASPVENWHLGSIGLSGS